MVPLEDRTPGLPYPDPTKLTTDAVDRAKADLRAEITVQEELQRTRLEIVHTKLTCERELRVSEHRALQEVVEERRIASATALQAALASAKELAQVQAEATAKAAEKSEQAFTKQIEALGAQLTTSIFGLGDRISGLGSRLDRGEGSETGHDKTEANYRSTVALVIATIAASGSMLFLIVAVATHGRF